MEEKLKQHHTNIIRIALCGPESTGKTTLAQQLATHYKTQWIPEFARDYLQQKWDNNKEICQPNDLIPIAIGQMELENSALSKANKFIFCDTTLLVTKIFSVTHYGFCDPVIAKAALENTYDLILLTDVDIAWVADDLRDAADTRFKEFEVYKNALKENNMPFVIVSGNKEERFLKATYLMDKMIKNSIEFSKYDLQQIGDLDISLDELYNKINFTVNGGSKIVLHRVATIGDGIQNFSEEESNFYKDFFDKKRANYTIEKFVPASGAATRMFKFLIDFYKKFNPESSSINAYINKEKAYELSTFFVGLEKFSFYNKLVKFCEREFPGYNQLSQDLKYYYLVKVMLESQYFNYSNKPKGLLPFHNINGKMSTPVHKHLKEAIAYTNTPEGPKVHFTVSKEFEEDFQRIVSDFENNVHVSYSNQKHSTDSLALDMENDPFRNQNGTLHFRPGGHGALIENLNDLNSDIVFVKNIDNVSFNHFKVIVDNKKILGGYLMHIQNRVFDILKNIVFINSRSEILDIIKFVKEQLHLSLPPDIESYGIEEQKLRLYKTLNRPIRVCGMVKNEGEPGGGPFWVKHPNEKINLQIVESSQIDMNNINQRFVFSQSTHFNPVDLVCSLKNYKGEKFNLKNYIDDQTGFVVNKTVDGRDLKAYELPGLWNGAMAKWITLFVEVPLETFNPVKTINDLLKPAHQHE